MESPTWQELAVAADTTPKQIVRRLQILSIYTAKYDEFCDAIEDAFDFAMKKAVEHKNIINPNGTNKGRMDEDQITAFLAMVLVGMCFDVTHSRNVGGNCDITVAGPHEMLWLGEAKIHSSYGKTLGGYQQLCDRYSTGLLNQHRGGLLIYSFVENAKNMMEEWRKYLADSRSLASTETCQKFPSHFLSTEPHAGTSLDIEVRHIAVPLYHEPTDTEPKPKRQV